MLKFAFILTVFNSAGDMSYVMDSNMSGDDCIEAVQNYMETNPTMHLGHPSCEIDMAESFIVHHEGQDLILAACEFEDSDMCLWDGQQHGNGKGRTFYTFEGVTHYLD